ncbi:MAG: hypothetical protein GY861_27840, partial [bacterium]|nr:hypothetical protein [bacterium]
MIPEDLERLKRLRQNMPDSTKKYYQGNNPPRFKPQNQPFRFRKPAGWSPKVNNRAELAANADVTTETSLSDWFQGGGAGFVLRLKESMKKSTLRTDSVSENRYVYDQLKSDSAKSELVIGPVRFAHSVQEIHITEDKAISAPKATRSDKPLLVDSGTGSHRAVIRFLFSGVDEINTFCRSLVVLFRSCPIISLTNEMLRSAWAPKPIDIIRTLKKEFRFVDAGTSDQEAVNRLYNNLIEKVKAGSLIHFSRDEVTKALG